MNERHREVNPFEDGSAWGALRGLPTFEEALARLLHTAEHGRALGIVRGVSGAGKSALLECVADESRQAGHECGRIDLRRSSADEFSWQLASELGAAPTSMRHCWRMVEDSMTGRALAGRPTLLLLDHLEAADAGLLRGVERLLAIAEASAGWCTILCAGRSLAPSVDALARQHAELRIELGPLEAGETSDLLRQVVTLSGCGSFTDEAINAIHQQTGGLVRDVMRLGRLSLFACYAEDVPEVTAEIVTMLAGETALPGPSRRLRAPAAPPLVTTTHIDRVTLQNH